MDARSTVGLYDAVLTACDRRDVRAVERAVDYLIASLDFDFDHAARLLVSVYADGTLHAARGRFDVAAAVFASLRQAASGA